MLRPLFLQLSLLIAVIATVTACRSTTTPPMSSPTDQAQVEKYAPFTPSPQPPAHWNGELQLPALFSDNMVLQQGMATPIWGWAKDGEKITVTFRHQTISTTAKDRRWQVKLRALRAGGSDVLTVAGQKTIQRTNVCVGEVWLCSGQSNMEWPLKRAYQPEADIAAATNTLLRLFVVPNLRRNAPTNDVAGQWEICSPETAANFSAVGYYFGRDLQTARGVPVGLIQSDWGGTPAEAWTRPDALASNPRYQAEIIEPYPAAMKKYEADLAVYEKEKAEAAKNKQEFKKWAPWRPWQGGELYNGMIAPLIPYALRGVIWYQGESNAGRAAQYHSLFPDMIRNWRHDWNQGDFPFLCVQLAPFKAIKTEPGESDWAELREAQLLATQILPQVGIAVITDVGEERDIHPAKKGPVGQRLALAARAIAYGEKIPYSGPLYKNVKFTSGQASIRFDHVGRGLEARGGSLQGFSICGADKQFHWAQAEIQPDNTITVHSPSVPNPVAVRFGWADYPVVNLWNQDGLPASPFRTDNFPMLTDPTNQK